MHFISERALDVEEFDVWASGADPDRVWRRYFETVAESARSGLYDVVAHPDLVKVWGRERPRPDGDLRRFYEPAVEAFAESGVAVEVSTAGWRKPVGELYPAPAYLEMVVDAGCPIALSSDAHTPDDQFRVSVGDLGRLPLAVDAVRAFLGWDDMLEESR